MDISRGGVRLQGLRSLLKIDEIVGLTYKENKIHFRVRWLGTPGTPSEGCVGLMNLTPERPLWDIALPTAASDDFRPESLGDRRRYPRVKCTVSVEIRAEHVAQMWGKASDISIGGCFVEMPIPLSQGTNFEISLWLGETKVKLRGEVASATPGYGVGIRFVDLTDKDKDMIDKFLSGFTAETADYPALAAAAGADGGATSTDLDSH